MYAPCMLSSPAQNDGASLCGAKLCIATAYLLCTVAVAGVMTDADLTICVYRSACI